MIPEPNLDDRKFEDILNEAIRLIPQYCPEWTNFNKSDPGITLLELFSWMTESVIYRLNRVPEKNFLAFLNLMGIDLQPPQPAKAVVTFSVSDKSDMVTIPQGTRLGTVASGERTQQVFESESAVNAVNNRLERVFSQHHEHYTDRSLAEGPFVRPEGFPIFEGINYNERFLYIGDERLVNFNDSARLTLKFDAPGWPKGYHTLFDWTYWNGERWVDLSVADVDLPRDAVAFRGVPRIEKTEINGVETYWLRGRLTHVRQDPRETELETMSMKIEIMGDALVPELAYLNAEGDYYLNLPLDKNFAPFGKEPGVDTTFYFKSDGALSQTDTVVEIEVKLSDASFAEAPNPSEDLHLRFEYYNGRKWSLLGFSGQRPARYRNRFDFLDETEQLSQNGRVTFKRPDDLSLVDVSGEEGHWLRCRVERGNYGQAGTYELDGSIWKWKEDNPLRPPYIRSLTMRFYEQEHLPERLTTYNDFVYVDYDSQLAEEFKRFQPFEIVDEENPTLYMGFRFPFPNEHMQLYFAVEESLDGAEEGRVELSDEGLRDRSIVWEYWSGKRWSDLVARDGTKGFTESGFLDFTGPVDWRKTKRFGEAQYWLRARLEMGGYEQHPHLRAVLINSVYARNLQTYVDTVLGSSEGTPSQGFNFPKHPVLPGEQLWVIESNPPSAKDLQRLQTDHGEDAVIEDADRGGWRVRWQRVENFFDSDAASRHYVRDVVSDQIRFGDGIHGMVPPKGDRNVIAGRYQIGGGTDGNVPADAIRVMKQKIAYVDGVTNLFAATDGGNLETIEEIKRRGPHFLKSRNRAVTAEDFEWLALQASGSVARVKCLPSRRREGEVNIIVVPKFTSVTADLREKPVPTPILLNKVKHYLDQRRMLTTVVHVARPSFVDLSIQVEIRRYSRSGSGHVKAEIDQALRRYLHPLRGGRDGGGWPFGRGIFKVDLYYIIEEIDGVDFVEQVRISDAVSGQGVEQLKLREDQLPFLLNVEVTERGMER